MKPKQLIVVVFYSLFTVFSCKKSNDGACWQILDQFGNPVSVVCDKTEAEMKATYPDPCSYYKTGDHFCWLIDGTVFIENVPEDYVYRVKQCHGYTTALKVSCDYCEKWYTRQKNLYKPTNKFTFSPVQTQQYCGDTVQTLFQGREIILRETADSLITLQFSNDGIF